MLNVKRWRTRKEKKQTAVEQTSFNKLCRYVADRAM